jgi:uncharacterized protein (DUF2147 family)
MNANTLIAVAAVLASPIGVWSTGSGADAGKVRIEPCGGALCGRVIDAARLRVEPDQRDARNRDPALRGRPIRGLTVLKGFTGGPAVWTGGEAYDPKTGDDSKNVQLRLTSPDRLAIKGCVAIFCRTEVWTRVR